MRCKSCDTLLTDKESVKKDPKGGYIDLCFECYRVSAGALAVALEEHRGELTKIFIDTQDPLVYNSTHKDTKEN